MEFLQSCIQVAFYGGLLMIGSGACQPVVKHHHCSVECLGRVSKKNMSKHAVFCRKDVFRYLSDSGFGWNGSKCLESFELHSVLFKFCMEKHLVPVVCRRTSGVKIKSQWNWVPLMNGYMAMPTPPMVKKARHHGHSHSHSH